MEQQPIVILALCAVVFGLLSSIGWLLEHRGAKRIKAEKNLSDTLATRFRRERDRARRERDEATKMFDEASAAAKPKVAVAIEQGKAGGWRYVIRSGVGENARTLNPQPLKGFPNATDAELAARYLFNPISIVTSTYEQVQERKRKARRKRNG